MPSAPLLLRTALAFSTLSPTSPYIFAPASLESMLSYFIRVYLRATFNTTVDVLVHLFMEPPSRSNRSTSLLLLLPSTSIVTYLLFRCRFLCPDCSCPQNLYNLIYTSACYSQVSLSDPRALQKTVACAEEHNLRQSLLGPILGPVKARRILFDKATRISRSCTPSDMSRAWTQACLIVSGADRGHQFGSGVSANLDKAFQILSKCQVRYGLDNGAMWAVEAAVAKS
jgi:hypothetical protein